MFNKFIKKRYGTWRNFWVPVGWMCVAQLPLSIATVLNQSLWLRLGAALFTPAWIISVLWLSDKYLQRRKARRLARDGGHDAR